MDLELARDEECVTIEPATPDGRKDLTLRRKGKTRSFELTVDSLNLFLQLTILDFSFEGAL